MRLPHKREPVHHVDETKRHSLRELVFGLEDGLVSTMGVITGIAAGTGSRVLVILSGLVVIFVESLSMGAGTYLGAKSESEMEAKMLDEELHEIRHHPEKERRELYEFYSKRGFSQEEQDMLVARMMSDEELLLEEMAHKELGIFPGKEGNPVRDAIIMFGAYIAGGLVPLLPYLFVGPALGIPLSVAGAAIALYIVGHAKGRLVGIAPWRSGLEMLVIAMTAAGIGYGVGTLAGHLLGVDPLGP